MMTNLRIVHRQILFSMIAYNATTQLTFPIIHIVLGLVECYKFCKEYSFPKFYLNVEITPHM